MAEEAHGAPQPPPRKGRDIPWVWVGVALVMLVALGRQLLTPEPSHPLVGTRVEELSLPVAEPGGDRLRLEDMRGQVVLLEFWASWCKACRASTPALNALHRRYEERGLAVLGVNADARDARMAAAGHRSFRARYPTLYDPDRRAQAVFEVSALPTAVLIDREGVVRRWEVGVLQERRWASWIADLL